MTKIRVYELAKELDMESKDVIRRLGKMGAEVKNHMSAVEDKHADMLRDIMRPKLMMAEKNKAVAKEKESKTAVAKEPAKETAASPDTPKAPSAGKETPAIRESAAQPASKTTPAADSSTPTPQAVDGKQAAITPEKPVKTAPAPVDSLKKPLPSQEIPPGVPRQQGVFQNRGKKPNQARQQGVFDKKSQPRQQGNVQGRGQNQGQSRPSANAQGRGQGRGQSSRPPGQQQRGQGQGQGRPAGDRQGQYQNRPAGERAGGPHQGRPPGERQAQGPRGAKPATPAGGATRTPERKDNRRFDQKKKPAFDNRKGKERDRNRFDSQGNRRPQKQQKKGRPKQAPREEMPAVAPKTVVIGESVIISELAKSMSKTAAEVIKKLMTLGIMATVNQEIDAETATIVAAEFGIEVQVKVDKALEMLVDDDSDHEDSLVERPPVVTVMGHVDHGKTSLLDAIRQTDVIASEAGGITQHIGAYQVEVSGKKITFLDTPGHEAFTSMRARGAQVTDIAILVVAADDGVMPQTVEAINHAKAANVPIIVAINKIDKEGANPERIRQELTEYELVPEDWGGSTIMVPVSAKKGDGIQNLLEMILLVAEVEELKSNPDRNARGTVIEAQLDKGRGAVATVLVQKGTLKIGDILVAGTEFARVRALIDDKGRRIKVATPSMPAEILGFSDVPPPGEIFVCVDDEKDARHIAHYNALNQREKDLNKSSMVSLDDLFKQISEGMVKELNIVLKADVQGSIEALSQSIRNLSTDEVRVNIIHSGVGAIIESDVMLAAASNALIIGFNVRPIANTNKAAEQEGVDIRTYRVIYEALDDIKAAMSGLLDPEYKEVIIGQVVVRDVIKVPKVGFIAGAYVTEGKVTRNAKVRLLRNGIVVYEGDINSLRRFKDDVKEVAQGYECGIGLENFNDMKVDDQMEIYIMEETKRAL